MRLSHGCGAPAVVGLMLTLKQDQRSGRGRLGIVRAPAPGAKRRARSQGDAGGVPLVPLSPNARWPAKTLGDRGDSGPRREHRHHGVVPVNVPLDLALARGAGPGRVQLGELTRRSSSGLSSGLIRPCPPMVATVQGTGPDQRKGRHRTAPDFDPRHSKAWVGKPRDTGCVPTVPVSRYGQ